MLDIKNIGNQGNISTARTTLKVKLLLPQKIYIDDSVVGSVLT